MIFTCFPRFLGSQGEESQECAFADFDLLERTVYLAEVSWNQERMESDGQSRKE